MSSNGQVRTAQLGDSGKVTWKSTGRRWAGGHSQLIGQTNGSMYLYRASDGFSYTVTVDVNYRIRWVGTVKGIGPKQILTAAGGV